MNGTQLKVVQAHQPKPQTIQVQAITTALTKLDRQLLLFIRKNPNPAERTYAHMFNTIEGGTYLLSRLNRLVEAGLITRHPSRCGKRRMDRDVYALNKIFEVQLFLKLIQNEGSKSTVHLYLIPEKSSDTIKCVCGAGFSDNLFFIRMACPECGRENPFK